VGGRKMMSREVERMEEGEVVEILSYLTEYDELDGVARGIALQVIEKGMRSLIGNQIAVYDRQIRAKFLKIQCKRCGEELPTSEILEALTEGDGRCSWCRKLETDDG
jgi:hypothetical protein